ncbi:MAG: family 16 glycoside hydrolase [Rubripirellula sp.]
MMKTSDAFRMCFLLFAAVSFSDVIGADPDSDVGFEDSFDRSELGSGWNSTTGDWQIVDGVLCGKEIPEQKHSAATRRVLVTQNAIYQLRFRFTGDATAFHFGFDPAKGELEKKGHLFSIIVTPDSWKVMKHVDKNRRKEDPNEVLAEQDTEFNRDQWYALTVTTQGESVTARVDGKKSLEASHSTFGVKKPTLVFRCLGDGVEIDDIRVRSLATN